MGSQRTLSLWESGVGNLVTDSQALTLTVVILIISYIKSIDSFHFGIIFKIRKN